GALGLVARERAAPRLAFGHQAQLAVDPRPPPGRHPMQRDRPASRGQAAGDHVQEGALAGAVGAEQPGDARTQGHAHVVDRHHVAVPAGHPGQFHHARRATHRCTLRYLTSSSPMKAATTATVTTPYQTPYSPGYGAPSSPNSHTRTPRISVPGLNRPASFWTASPPTADSRPTTGVVTRKAATTAPAATAR